MSKKLTRLAGMIASVGLLFGAGAVPVQAQFMGQFQEMGQSSSVSVTGGGSANASATQTARQMQVMDAGAGFVAAPVVHRSYRATRAAAPRRYATAHISSAHVSIVSEGRVRLTWDMRSGTCHVRYGEASNTFYSYNTSASCDDGGVTIGGLESGRKYRFQVRQNDGAWSRAVVVKAL